MNNVRAKSANSQVANTAMAISKAVGIERLQSGTGPRSWTMNIFIKIL